MSILILRPNGDDPIFNQEWTPTGETENFACVDEPTSDGDTTYVYTNSSYSSDRYTLEDTPSEITEDTTINSITVHLVAKGVGDISCWVKESGGTNSIGTATLTSSYVDYEFTYYEPIYNAPPFNKGYIDNLIVGPDTPFAANEKYVTQVYVEIDYTEASTTPTVGVKYPLPAFSV